MGHQIVSTDKAPAAIGPYSQAVSAQTGRIVFLSGQIPVDPATGNMVNESVSAEVLQVLANLDEVLKAAGLDRESVAKTTIFLTNMGDFALVNAIYGEFFGEHRPARATIQVAALPKGARVEIEAIAVEPA